MNNLVFDAIKDALEQLDIIYEVVDHEPCRTSEESALARAELGYTNTVGAKALLLRLRQQSSRVRYLVALIPATLRLDSKAIRKHSSGVKSIRFASPEEFETVTYGLVPGSLPPFAKPVFPMIEELIVDHGFLETDTIGFNAGSLDRSIIMPTTEFLRLMEPHQFHLIAKQS